MTGLLLDTSLGKGWVALAREGELIQFSLLPEERSLSQELIPCINTLLSTHSILPGQLSYIAGGLGPGSHTGTRTGATITQTLSFALNIPLVGFHSPLAHLVPGEGTFAIVVEAKSGAFFLLKGTSKTDQILSYTYHPFLAPEALAVHLDGIERIISSNPKEHFLSLEPLAAYTYQKFLSGLPSPFEVSYLN
jgi:tRNA threonylcarbamoyladenosine biosynthesis protein TsaB